jgi:two-component system, sensor histidine kinase
VFELFEQGDKSLERGNTGLGIGLTLARQLVLLHGGSIRVASEGIGRGSTFTVELPTALSSPQGLPAPAPAIDLGSLAGANVLVADDNVDFAVSLRAALETAGLRVRAVNDGRAALAAASLHAPDLAILDIGMPGLNGYEVARRIRAEPWAATTFLVAATGWGQDSDRRKADEAGFDLHLTKPFDPEQLLQTVAAHRS